MIEHKEKTINNRTYFIGKINPVETMTISRAAISLYKRNAAGEFELDLSSQRNVDSLNTYYNMVFERMNVKLSESIIKPVKEKGNEVWWPECIQEEYDTLFALANWFFEEVIVPVFLKSSESMKNSDSLDDQTATSKNANDKE